MAITFTCANPACRKKFNAKDEYAGKKFTCTACRTSTTIPDTMGALKPFATPAELHSTRERTPVPPVSADIGPHHLPASNGTTTAPRVATLQPPQTSWPLFAGAAAAISSLGLLAIVAFLNSNSILLAILVGLTFGGIFGGLIMYLNSGSQRAQLAIERAQLEAKLNSYTDEQKWIESAKQELHATFQLLASRSEAKFAEHASQAENSLRRFAAGSAKEMNDLSRANAADFSRQIGNQLDSHVAQISLLKNSLETNIGQMDQYVRELESKRERAYASLREVFQDFCSQSVGSLTDKARENADVFSGKIQTHLTTHSEKIGSLRTSLETNISQMDQHVRELEVKREVAYSGLKESIVSLQTAYGELRDTTHQLVNALKTGPVRGTWGEIQLRKVVELAGMEEHVSFRQQMVGIDDGKPDVVVKLPKEGSITVDSKFPAQSYLEAMTCTDPILRCQKLDEHTDALKKMIKDLSKKSYWDQFQASPELVILFVPIESCLIAAYERDPNIIEFALSQNVMLASPITLLGFLKAIAYGWQQFRFSNDAKKIFEQGKELYKRADKWMDHYRKAGEKIASAVDAFNESVASLQTRFYPAARRFRELTGIQDELKDVSEVLEAVHLPPPPEDDGMPT